MLTMIDIFIGLCYVLIKRWRETFGGLHYRAVGIIPAAFLYGRGVVS